MPNTRLPEAPALSVVISVFNGEDRLDASLLSVLQQQGPSFEVIIINDGSGPTATAILRGFAARDARIRLIEQENTGLTRALIRGCTAARAPIIVRHDADDISLPGRFASLEQAFADHREASLVTSWAACYGPKGEFLHIVKRPEDPVGFQRGVLEFAYGMPAHGATAFRRKCYEAVGGYREQFYFAQDNDLWLRLASLGTTVCVPACLYAYFLRPGATSGRHAVHQKMYGDLGMACHRARQTGGDETALLAQASTIRQSVAPTLHYATARAHYFVGACLAARRDRRCIPYLWGAWLRVPWNPRYLIRAVASLATLASRPRAIDNYSLPR